MISFDEGYSRNRLGGQLIWFLVWVAVTVVAAFLSPSPAGHGTHQQLGLPPCPSVLLFNRLCPGCGLTTSFTAMVHGQPGLAWQANPFGVLFYPGFTVSAWLCLYAYIKGKRINTNSAAFQWSIGIVLVSFLLYGAWRFTTQPTGPFPPSSSAPSFFKRSD